MKHDGIMLVFPPLPRETTMLIEPLILALILAVGIVRALVLIQVLFTAYGWEVRRD